MNKHVGNNPESDVAGEEEAATVDEDRSAEETARTAPTEEWVKGSQDEEIVRVVSEILGGQQAAAVYIDARSGGFFFGTEAHILGTVAVTMLDKINTVYTKPPLFTQADTILQEKHLLILWGQTHWGKWTTALYLLANLYEKNIFEISPKVDLSNLRTLVWATGQGYGIDTLAFEQANKLTIFNLQHLSNELQKRNSHLIITIDSQTSLPNDVLNQYALDWREIPEQNSILSNHLKWYSFGDENLRRRAGKICQNSTVQDFLNMHSLPKDIDRLVDLVMLLTSTVYQKAFSKSRARTQMQILDEIVDSVQTKVSSDIIDPRGLLRQILTERFNESELHNLSFDLGVDYETLPGRAKQDKARELVTYLERRDRLPELIQICYQLRPNAPWWGTLGKIWETSPRPIESDEFG